jgi:amino acid transporter
MTSLTIISILVPFGDSRLLGEDSKNAKASPFVIAINNASIKVLPSIFNAVILIAVLSVGNSSVYGSSRTLAALADQGQAPKFFSYIDRQGRPLFAIIFASIIGLLCYIVAGGGNVANVTLQWLYSLCGLSTVFTWGSICLCHIRFRKAWRSGGNTLEDLPYRSHVGLWGSWLGLILNCLILIAQFWTAIWPIGYAKKTSREIAENFFLAYLAAPVVIMFYISYKLAFKTSIMKTEEMDIDTGRREVDAKELIDEEKAAYGMTPKWKRAYNILC